jgi:hypothetical protein
MDKKTILKSTIIIVGIMLVCFGIMWLFLFMFNDTDVGSTEEPIDTNNTQILIGAWETIDFKTSDGSSILDKEKKIIWVFSESEVRYFENEVEVMGRAFSYQWINNDTIRMTDGGSQTRTWRITFIDNDTIIVNEPNSGYRRTLARVTKTE